MPKLVYDNDPKHDNSILQTRSECPYNAEPHLEKLVEERITPEDVFFVRLHGPVPDLKEEDYAVVIDGLVKKPLTLSIADIKTKYEQRQVEATLVCAGNRRDGLNRVQKTQGVIWGPGAVSNAIWKGTSLRDVLADAGVPTSMRDPVMEQYHVIFEGADQGEEDKHYGSSIPLSKAMDEVGDVLLAYEMNGKPLTGFHGYPLRVVVPGYIGARSVKYVNRITVSDKESPHFYQQRDYKILPQTIQSEEDAETEWERYPAIGEMNVQSVICQPASMDDIHWDEKQMLKGYALVGGGHAIQRIDISIDGGAHWTQADICHDRKPGGRHWAWTLWQKEVDFSQVDPSDRHNVRIVCRAIDQLGNSQPETPIWNFRGVMNNAWSEILWEKDIGQEAPELP